jgi:hypothetical protein
MTLADEKSAIAEHDQRTSDIETADTKQAYLPEKDEDYNVTFKTWVVVMVSVIEAAWMRSLKTSTTRILTLEADLVVVLRNFILVSF